MELTRRVNRCVSSSGRHPTRITHEELTRQKRGSGGVAIRSGKTAV
jgi:hypothetical protein